MDSFSAALGIGGLMEITAIADTWIKSSPIDSTELSSTQKVQIRKGDKVRAYAYSIAGKHIKFQSPDPRCFTDSYLWLDHVTYQGKITQLVTLEQLIAIAPYSPQDTLAKLVSGLNEGMQKYEINQPLRICHFLAQIAHESDGFYALEEYADGSDYEGRADLGNTFKGDGKRYKGRGLIQLTGRANYREISQDLSVDFVGSPALLSSHQYAAISATWFWWKRGLNLYADRDNFDKITRIINGGVNGYDDRFRYLIRAKNVFGL